MSDPLYYFRRHLSLLITEPAEHHAAHLAAIRRMGTHPAIRAELAENPTLARRYAVAMERMAS